MRKHPLDQALAALDVPRSVGHAIRQSARHVLLMGRIVMAVSAVIESTSLDRYRSPYKTTLVLLLALAAILFLPNAVSHVDEPKRSPKKTKLLPSPARRPLQRRLTPLAILPRRL